jgi:nucleoside-diphosphate-sugar epimerase
MKKARGVVHLAARSNRRSCEEDPAECIRINLLSLCYVLEAALRCKAWVIFASTFQVLDEHIYGMSKLIGEELCRLYQAKGLRVKILRFPIVYGPGDRPYKVVTKIISEVESGKLPKIETDKKFHFLYVDDVADLIEAEVDVMNCASGKKYSLRELVVGIKDCMQKGRVHGKR